MTVAECAPWLGFFRHVPGAPAPDSVPIARLAGACCPGEMMSLSVSLRARDAIREVVIDVSELLGDDGRVIPRAAIDAFVVREWDQAGVGVYQSAPARVAELLLKDGQADLRDGYGHRCGHWRHFRRRGPFYGPPDLRLRGEARTALDATRAQQVWIAVRMPARTSAGLYRGVVHVRAVSPPLGHAHLPLEVEVLPLMLAESTRDRFLWYRGTLDCRRPRYHVSEALFRAQLEDIQAHGFRTISLGESDPELLQRAIDIAHSTGFRARVVLTDPFPARLDAVDFRGLQPILYISDEMDVRGPAAVAAHVANAREAKRRGVPTMCALVQEQFARRLFDAGDIGHPPDILLHYLPRNREFFALLSEVPGLRRRPTYFYWHAHMEKPLLHRVLAGIYFWKSGADGIAPYCYQHLPEHPYSPYDDFDEWDSHERAVSGGHAFKDHLATYPARRGSVPTLQWKGLSAGLYDLRYLETLSALQREATARGGAAASMAEDVDAAVGAVVRRISLRDIEITSDDDVRPYPDLEAQDLEAFRELVSRGAVEIYRLL
jgi:hypothetical protein